MSFSIMELMQRVTVLLITCNYDKNLQANGSARIGRRQVMIASPQGIQGKHKSFLNPDES
jgi:hypothetical protein